MERPAGDTGINGLVSGALRDVGAGSTFSRVGVQAQRQDYRPRPSDPFAGIPRLAAMNLLLHGIGPLKADEGTPPITIGDSLASRGTTR